MSTSAPIAPARADASRQPTPNTASTPSRPISTIGIRSPASDDDTLDRPNAASRGVRVRAPSASGAVGQDVTEPGAW